MKAVVLAIIVLVVCIVLFFAGLISPRRSKKMQASVDDLSKKGERKADEKAGRLGDMTSAALEKSRAAADASARAGRKVHGEISRDD